MIRSNYLLRASLGVWIALVQIIRPSYSLERLSCDRVTIRALDKITAKVSELSVKVGEVITFGTLDIALHQCWKNAPEDPPEALAFLEIKETKTHKNSFPVFKGWMFASYPAVSALEHPVYDVWIKEGLGTLPLSEMQKSQTSLPLGPNDPSLKPEDSFNDPEASPDNFQPEENSDDAMAALYRGLERSKNIP